MYYLFYSCLFFFIGFLIVNKNATNKLILYWYYLGIVLFWGMAYHYAIDTDGYIDFFYNEVQPLYMGLNLGLHKFESGFNFLAALCKTICPHYIFFQLVLLGGEMLLIINGFKRLFKEDELLLCIPLLFFLFPTLLSAPRQGISIAIFIYALPYINGEKSWRYFVFILIASLFHRSSILLLVVYFGKYLKGLLSKNWVLFSVLGIADLCWVLGFSLADSMDFLTQFLASDWLDMEDYASHYIEEAMLESNFGLAKILEINIVTLAFGLFCKEYKNEELFRFVLIVYAVMGLVFGGLFAHRIMYYFQIVYYACMVLGISNALKRLNFQYTRQLCYSVLSVYMLWFFLFHSGYVRKVYTLLPYVTYNYI